MTAAPSTVPTPRAGGIPLAWMGMALFAHTAWGAYPVLSRYLQTVSLLPTMAMIALGNLIALAVYAPFALPRLDRSAPRSPVIWGFTLVVVLRALTNVLAARYTQAIYVQLVTLNTPLLVALLSAGLFREQLPPLTWSVIGLSLLGSLLMMSSDIGPGGLRLALSASDMIGIALALTSAVSLAVYMIVVPRTVKAAVPSEAVLVVQLTALTATSGVLSLALREDWGRYLELGPLDWAVYITFVVAVLLGANLGQIAALRRLGAPLVSSSMAWRLVATIALAALLLGERLTSPGQFAGAALVLATITVYLWRQRTV